MLSCVSWQLASGCVDEVVWLQVGRLNYANIGKQLNDGYKKDLPQIALDNWAKIEKLCSCFKSMGTMSRVRPESPKRVKRLAQIVYAD